MSELVKVSDEFSRLMGVSNLSTTLDLSTDAGRETLAKALDFDNPKLDGVINTEIQIVNLVMRDMDFVNNLTGEVKTEVAVALCCADGNFFFTTASSIRRALFLASLRRGKPPWNPPLRVIVRQKNIKRRNGEPGRVYNLEVIDDANHKAGA